MMLMLYFRTFPYIKHLSKSIRIVWCKRAILVGTVIGDETLGDRGAWRSGFAKLDAVVRNINKT